ncbi:hypothetical protein Tco_0475896 [Tanacetum coccineum]
MFRGDKLRVMQAVVQRVMLQAQGLTEIWELIEQLRKRSLDAITVKVKVTWKDNTKELTTTAYDLDAFDSNCEEAPSASAVLSAVLSEEPVKKDIRTSFNQFGQNVICIAMHDDLDNKCVLPANDGNLAYAEMEQSYIDEYSRCLKLEAELSKKKDMVEKAVYNKLSNKCTRLEKHCISLEIKVQQNKESFHNDRPCKNQDAPEFPEFFEINDLKAQLQKKNTKISNLKDHIATLKRKKQARALQPLDSALDYACKFTTRIQELLVYVTATCPSSINKSKKLVVVTPMNKSRKVKFTKPSTSTSNILKQVDSQNTQTTNKPLLTSTGVNISTHASGSKPKGNTRNNRISRTSSSNQKNKKVEDHPRNAKTSLNKKNRVSNCNESTKHVVLNANSEFVYSTCNECLFNACHDMCVVDYLNVVNSRARVKSVKSNKKKEWKRTGKVFTNVGHRWLPTGRTFTIDGTKCPLTRITSTTVVPPKETSQTNVITKMPALKVYKRKPKAKKK